MRKIKFAIASTFIIIFMIANFAFAAEVKNTSPATPPVNVAPAATPPASVSRVCPVLQSW